MASGEARPAANIVDTGAIFREVIGSEYDTRERSDLARIQAAYGDNTSYDSTYPSNPYPENRATVSSPTVPDRGTARSPRDRFAASAPVTPASYYTALYQDRPFQERPTRPVYTPGIGERRAFIDPDSSRPFRQHLSHQQEPPVIGRAAPVQAAAITNYHRGWQPEQLHGPKNPQVLTYALGGIAAEAAARLIVVPGATAPTKPSRQPNVARAAVPPAVKPAAPHTTELRVASPPPHIPSGPQIGRARVQEARHAATPDGFDLSAGGATAYSKKMQGLDRYDPEKSKVIPMTEYGEDLVQYWSGRPNIKRPAGYMQDTQAIITTSRQNPKNERNSAAAKAEKTPPTREERDLSFLTTYNPLRPEEIDDKTVGVTTSSMNILPPKIQEERPLFSRGEHRRPRRFVARAIGLLASAGVIVGTITYQTPSAY